MKKKHILTSILCAAALLVQPFTLAAIPAAADGSGEPTVFTFEGEKLEVTAEGEAKGYKISGTELTINDAGMYMVTGASESGSIKVKKGTTGVVLILSSLSLKNKTAPLVCGKNTEAEIAFNGVCTLEDSVENSEDYWLDQGKTDSDSEVDAAENAVIKLKGGSKITMGGFGKVNIKANAKNGIKSGSTLDSDLETELPADPSSKYYSYLTVDGAYITIDATNAYIPTSSSDSDTSADTGFPGKPGGPEGPGGMMPGGQDEKPSTAVGDGINAESCLNIKSGSVTVKAGDDGLHSDYLMTIGTLGAKNDDLSVNIEQSYEGIEAASLKFYSGNINIAAQDDAINAANGDLGNYAFDVSIFGGNIYADASDGNDNDAIDSNGTINIYGGKTIAVTDQSGNAFDGDGEFNVYGGTVLGLGNSRMAIRPTNKSTRTDWCVAQWGGMGGQGMISLLPDQGGSGGSTSSIVLRSGEREPVSAGNTPSIAAGEEVRVLYEDTSELIGTTAKSSANYAIYAGKNIPDWIWTLRLEPNGAEGEAYEEMCSPGGSVKLDSDVFTREGYYLKEWNTKPDGSGESVAIGTEYYVYSDVTLYAIWREDKTCKIVYNTNEEGKINLTMESGTRCGESHTVREALESDPSFAVFMSWNTEADGSGTTYYPGDEIVVEDDIDLYAQWSRGYKATFVCDEGVEKIIVCKTKDMSGGSTATEAYALNGDTGEIDMSGDGQINFIVLLKDGYTIDSVTATEGKYKNVKGPDETKVENGYRVTKITGDLDVNVKTNEPEQETDTGKDTDTEKDTDSGSFEVGNAGAWFVYNYTQVNVISYDTQKYENGHENASIVWARDAETGEIMNDGTGQVNFELVPAEGYVLDSIRVEPQNVYKSFMQPDELGRDNTYRFTDMTGGATVYIDMKKSDGSSDDDYGDWHEYNVKFNIEHGSVTTFQKGIGEPTYNSTSTTTGYDLLSRTQMAAFSIVPDEGYKLASVDDISVSGDYKDIQKYDLMETYGFPNYCTIRVVKSDLVVTIKLTPTDAASDTDSETSDTDSENSDTDSKASDTDSKTSDTDSNDSDTDNKNSDTDSKDSDTDSKPSDETVRVLMGDTTLDGEIYSDDALAALRHSLALNSLTGIAKAAGDVDEDGFIYSADALLILRYSVRFVDEGSCVGEYREISKLKL